MNIFSIKQVNQIPEGFNNNLVWNAGHIVSVQEALTYGLSGLRWTAPKEIVKGFRKDSKPEGVIDSENFKVITTELMTSIDRLEQNYNDGLFKEYQEFITLTGHKLTNIEEAIQFNIFHEGLHLGYMMSIKKFLK